MRAPLNLSVTRRAECCRGETSDPIRRNAALVGFGSWTISAHPAGSGTQRRLVVVGGGMVAHRLVEALADRDDATSSWPVDVFAEESRPPYDRVALTSFFSGRDPEDLLLGDPGLWRREGIRLHTNAPVQRIDTERARGARRAAASSGTTPWCSPPGPAPPCRPSRAATCRAASSTAPSTTSPSSAAGRPPATSKRPVRGAVVGGGLLGLEAAGALTAMGVETTVVEFAPRLMPLQVDEGGGEGLRRLIEKLGVTVRTSTATAKVRVRQHAAGSTGWTSPTARSLARRPGRLRHRRPAARRARPRGRPGGRRARRRRGRRGLRDRPVAATSSRSARSPASRAAPGAWSRPATRWPRSWPTGCSAVRPRSPAPTSPPSSSCSASTWPASATRSRSHPARSRSCTPTRWPAPTRSSCMSDDAQTLLGGVLVGDASAYAALRPMVGQKLGADPTCVAAARGRGAARPRPTCPTTRTSARATTSTRGSIRCAVSEQGCTDLAGVKACTRAGTSLRLLPAAGEEAGHHRAREVRRRPSATRCASTSSSPGPSSSTSSACRGCGTFSEIIERHGRGRGCDICRPVVRLDPGQPRQGSRARPRHRAAAGHQRPRDGQPAEGRHLLGRPARPRWRDHARRG